jgi:hypothetical protein
MVVSITELAESIPGPDQDEQLEYERYAMEAYLEASQVAWARNAAGLPDHARVPLTDQRDLQEAGLGTFIELAELINETDWKSWRGSRPMDGERRTRLLEEWADVQVFLTRLSMNLKAMYGVTPAELAEAWVRVSERNGARFRGEVPGREPPTPIT